MASKPSKTKESPWNIGAMWDHRFSTITLRVTGPSKFPPEGLAFVMPISQLLKALGIPLEDVAATYEERATWTEGANNIDGARIRLLESVDWHGKDVLDVGGYDGFAAEIAHKNGATSAICLDSHQYAHYGWEEKKKEGVDYVTGDLANYDVCGDDENQLFCRVLGGRILLPRPDVLIAYNILYHTHHPWQMLSQMRRILKPEGEMLLCTLFRYHKGSWMYLYEPRECNPTDETVYFGPSLEALERLLTATGWLYEQYALAFDRVLYRCRPNPDWVEKHPEPGD